MSEAEVTEVVTIQEVEPEPGQEQDPEQVQEAPPQKNQATQKNQARLMLETMAEMLEGILNTQTGIIEVLQKLTVATERHTILQNRLQETLESLLVRREPETLDAISGALRVEMENLLRQRSLMTQTQQISSPTPVSQTAEAPASPRETEAMRHNREAIRKLLHKHD